MNTATNSLILFLIGLFSQTEIRLVGNICISEVPIFLYAPILFIRDYRTLKNGGVLFFLGLVFSAMIGCAISSCLNSTPMAFFARGFASVYAIFAHTVVLYHLLSRNLKGLRWLLIGIAISSILCIFVFQQGRLMDGSLKGQGIGETSQDAVVNGALFWVGRVGQWALLPIKGWYLNIPLMYSVVVPISYALFCVFVTDSGRSAAMTTLMGAIFIMIVGKSHRKMRKIGRHFLSVLLIMGITGAVAKYGYSYFAKRGTLGEKQQSKYYAQTETGTGVMSFLRSGRAEFFIGLDAVLDKPIVGFGPWANDKGGYIDAYMSKHASVEDMTQYLRVRAEQIKMGFTERLLPSHSMLIGFWLWYGLPGAVLWVYVLYLLFTVMRKYLWAVPQLFGFLMLGIPSFIWHIFFSPFGARMERTLFIVIVLIVRAVGRGAIRPSEEMILEIRKHE